ncbi:unnamed protein product (macronuclear) [Paramecium tetraurelia]|uniref:Uncharacterized protein n=1 Tax=Paramecium tetraurelia TaxID=5888 RepID=A0BF08_PARTE|nr:uncharacterized protein GSPATT00028160001 [Paramecium tetraurelia]CAK57125.1 unnamed protein product [Paramecium tetraurelia]|eukprot:XP_001424523.1 hypothetical protein (macronuclear) [Paramecium tetraurelia strain d4-2]
MNHAYYVPSQQISYHIQQQPCQNRNPDNIAEKLKLLKSKKHVNQSLHTNKDYLNKQHSIKSQKNISSTKLHSSRRLKSQDEEQISQIMNDAIRQLPKQSKRINGYLVKQQLSSNSYQIHKQQKISDYHTVNKDKTVIKTEPDTQLCSDRILCYKTPIIIPKQIQSKEQIKSICNLISPQHKPAEEITNLKLEIRNQNHRKNYKLKTEVQEKILDLLLLSTRELKIKLSDKKTKQTSIPKTTRAGLPVDFFNFKK